MPRTERLAERVDDDDFSRRVLFNGSQGIGQCVQQILGECVEGLWPVECPFDDPGQGFRTQKKLIHFNMLHS